jgi:Arc/MetJ-type ribon-helix-helix transcriptional regulator
MQGLGKSVVVNPLLMSDAGTSRSDFIRHAIRFCIQNRACIETYLHSVGLEEERKKRSREGKDVKVYSFD